jgi:putative transcriptional regulator
MNRIAELRQLKGWSQEHLAKQLHVSKMTISRIESGKQDLTVSWLQRLARVFEVFTLDLLDFAALADIQSDVEPVAAEGSLNEVATAIAERDLHLYRVTGSSVSGAGVKPGDTITVDQSEDEIRKVRTGAIVLVQIESLKALVLRQFVSPNILLTNWAGPKVAFGLDDSSIGPKPKIVGVVLQKNPGHLRSGPHAPGTTEGRSWASGYVEGKATTHTYSAARPTSRPSKKAVSLEGGGKIARIKRRRRQPSAHVQSPTPR